MQTVLETGETVFQDSNLLVDTSSLDITELYYLWYKYKHSVVQK